VAGGFEVGLGAEFNAPSLAAANSVIRAARSPDEARPDSTVSLDSVTLYIGAWLSGDVGVGSASASAEVEGVVGAKISYENDAPTQTEYYVEINASGDGSLDLISYADSASDAGLPSPGGDLRGTLLLGITVDNFDNPISGELDVTAGMDEFLDMDAEIPKAPKRSRKWPKFLSKLGVGVSGNLEAGYEGHIVISVDLTDEHNLQTVSELFGNQQTTQSPEALLDDLLRESTITLTEYRVFTTKGGAKAQAGVGGGVKFDVSAETTAKELVSPGGAVAKTPGGDTFVPWTECQKGTTGKSPSA
jgi:hypothetical protein